MGKLYSIFRLRRWLSILFLTSLVFSLWLGQGISTTWQTGLGKVVMAQSSTPSQLVQQGVELYQKGDFQGAIARWQTALSAYQNSNNRALAAIVIKNLAKAHQQIGQASQAIDYWKQAIAFYRQLGNLSEIGKILIEQAQAYSRLGQYRSAIELLCGGFDLRQSCTSESAVEIARTQNDRQGEAAAWGSLGDAYRLRGSYNQAITVLENSLKIARELNNSVYSYSAFNSLGNAYVGLAKVNYRRANSAEQMGDNTQAKQLREQAFNYDAKALEYFQQSLNLARTQNDLQGELRILVNFIPLTRRTQKTNLADRTLQEALNLLDRIPDSRNKVFAFIDLTNLLQPIAFIEETSSLTQCLKPELGKQAEELLDRAVQVARRLQDFRAQSFVFGQLGHLYECRHAYDKAIYFTRQAQWAADQDLESKDSLYLWEWQAGRIFQANNEKKEAISAYKRAVATLEKIRSDISIADRDLQFDFRDAVAPIYRELARLQLEETNTPQALTVALNTIDSLKLAELQNYFGNDCVVTAISSDSGKLLAESTAAVFNFVILDESTAIVLSLPNGEKKLIWIAIDRENLRKEINQFRIELERYRDYTYEPQQAQKLYNLLVRPFADDLSRAKVETLVFIPDGILRSVPMAALHDGEQFLVEKYAIATTPSLPLTASKTANPQQLRVLALGLTKEAMVGDRQFPALDYVSSEIERLKILFPDTKELLNEDFTRDRLRQELDKTVYPIIHIATHGQFATIPEDTFLVTGNNQKLTIYDLDEAIRSTNTTSNSVDLLALTACQTAVGDERAALGLAGVALQAGVKSALASLWFVEDASTADLVTKFYANINDLGLSKAKALQTAQLALIKSGGKYAHPAYWAPFILIGNWL